MVYDNIGAAGLYIFSRAKPTLRQPLSDTRESSEKTVPTSLPTVPSFPRRRESRPTAFRNIQRLPQHGLCPRIWFTAISDVGRILESDILYIGEIAYSDVGRILESDILDIGEIAYSGGQVNGLSDICSKL